MIVRQHPLFRFVIILVIGISLGIPFVYAANITSPQGWGNVSDNSTLTKSANYSPSYQGEQTTHSNRTKIPVTGSEINHNAQNNSTTDTNSSREKYYASISEIIRANDWVALQNYTEKLKQDNPGAFIDPNPSTEAGWKVRFPIRTPAPIAQPCCTG